MNKRLIISMCLSFLVCANTLADGEKELEKALALNTESPNVLYSLGVVYYKLGKLGLSKAYFGKVLEVDPGHDDARGLMEIVANLEREQQEDGSQP